MKSLILLAAGLCCFKAYSYDESRILFDSKYSVPAPSSPPSSLTNSLPGSLINSRDDSKSPPHHPAIFWDIRSKRWEIYGKWLLAHEKTTQLASRLSGQEKCPPLYGEYLELWSKKTEARLIEFEASCLEGGRDDFCLEEEQRANDFLRALDDLTSSLSECLSETVTTYPPTVFGKQVGADFSYNNANVDSSGQRISAFEAALRSKLSANLSRWVSKEFTLSEDLALKRLQPGFGLDYRFSSHWIAPFSDASLIVDAYSGREQQKFSRLSEIDFRRNQFAEATLGIPIASGSLGLTYSLNLQDTSAGLYSGFIQTAQAEFPLSEKLDSRQSLVVLAVFYRAFALAVIPSWQNLFLGYHLKSFLKFGGSGDLKVGVFEHRNSRQFVHPYPFFDFSLSTSRMPSSWMGELTNRHQLSDGFQTRLNLFYKPSEFSYWTSLAEALGTSFEVNFHYKRSTFESLWSLKRLTYESFPFDKLQNWQLDWSLRMDYQYSQEGAFEIQLSLFKNYLSDPVMGFNQFWIAKESSSDLAWSIMMGTKYEF